MASKISLQDLFSRCQRASEIVDIFDFEIYSWPVIFLYSVHLFSMDFARDLLVYVARFGVV